MSRYKFAGPLYKIAYGHDPGETRGRKKGTRGKEVRGQKLGKLLADIAEISTAEPQLGRQEIARRLIEYAAYKKLPRWTMQRRVAAALDWQTNILKIAVLGSVLPELRRAPPHQVLPELWHAPHLWPDIPPDLWYIPPHRWPELFGIDPPAEINEQALEAKALEVLREALRRSDATEN
jgi:hypothetical protein